MKTLFVLFLSMGFLFCAIDAAHAQDPTVITPNPIPQHGPGTNTGGSKAPVHLDCPLTLYYSEASCMLEFVNNIMQPITFSYTICDENEVPLLNGSLNINANDNFILSLSTLTNQPYNIRIDITGVNFEGHFDWHTT